MFYEEGEMMGKGCLHRVSEEDIKKWLAISPEMRLDWLKEINEFVWKFAPKKSRQIMSRFRRGGALSCTHFSNNLCP